MHAGAAPWAQTLRESWRHRGPLSWLLWPVSLLYGALVALRRRLYQLGLLKVRRVPVPVVIVGNVVAGGAGKTPVVIALVQHWQAQGLRVGVVSRGYGRRSTDCREVQPDSQVTDVGDEPALVKHVTQAPVFVARERFEAASALLARYPQTNLIVCDDGLQHFALYRDLEICVFDDRGVGNGLLLPAGPLREPWRGRSAPSLPWRSDVPALVLHSGSQPAFAGYTASRQLADDALQADGTRRPLAQLAERAQSGTAPLLALAAIARPEVFFDMLRARGLPLARTLALPDHYDFDSWSSSLYKGYTLICTEKDAVKLWPHAPAAIAVPLQITLAPDFLDALGRALPIPTPSKLSSQHEHTH
jgi:tetraacyldisaccharide 4'-kinase